MPKAMTQIVYGKISITSDAPIKELEITLSRILVDHGYPEISVSKADKEKAKKALDDAEEEFTKELKELDDVGSAARNLQKDQ